MERRQTRRHGEEAEEEGEQSRRSTLNTSNHFLLRSSVAMKRCSLGWNKASVSFRIAAAFILTCLYWKSPRVGEEAGQPKGGRGAYGGRVA